MGNRIIFEVSIDIAPFRKTIGEMTQITNDFFDMADSRAIAFSEKLASIGNDFSIHEQFNDLNRSISEGAEIIESYNNNFSDMYDAAIGAATTFVGLLGPKGIVTGMATQFAHDMGWFDSLRSEIPIINDVYRTLIGGFAEIGRATGDIGGAIANHWRGGAEAAREMRGEMDTISIETIADMDYRMGQFSQDMTRNFEEVTEAHGGMTHSMLDDIRLFGYDWVEENLIRIHDTEETNESVKESFRSMSDDISAYAIAPLNDGWSGFCNDFEKGAKAASKSAAMYFENMAEDLSTGAATKMKKDFDTLWGGVKGGAGGTGHAIRSLFGSLPGEIRNPMNGIIGLVNGKVQSVTMGLNSVIGGINAMGFSLPPWLGGGSFAPNIPKILPSNIPMLARGGIVDRPTLALIGERGKEAVMPLENNTGWIADLANSIGAVVGAQLAFNQPAGQGSHPAMDSSRPIQLYLDGRKVAEGIMDDFVEVAKWRDVQLYPVFG